jgi:hypothetical protein
MKKLLIFAMATFLGVSIYAQMPQGGGFGGRGGFGGGERRGGMRPPEGRDFNGQDEELDLEHFPEIPHLTPEQKEHVVTVLHDEQKAIRKLESQKRELFKNEREGAKPDEKTMEKNRKKVAKIDAKIQKQIEKSNKKVAKKLSAEQYQVFLQKRHEFRFGNRRPPMSPHHRGEHDGRESMPPAGGGQRPDFRR